MVLLKYFNAGTLSTLSNVLACSRRSDRGDGATYFRRDVSRKKKNSEGVGTIFRQKMNRMIKLTKIEIVLRLRFLFHGTCMTDGTCK